MPTQLLHALIILFLLACGVASYITLRVNDIVSPLACILIAISCRTLSLLGYSHFSPAVREISGQAWLIFECLLPPIVLAELVLAACLLADALAELAPTLDAGERELN